MNIDLPMKTRSRLVGFFIIIAYSMLVGFATESKAVVCIADIVSGVAVVGIAVLMRPLLAEFGEMTSKLYLLLKWIEGLLMVLSGLFYLNTNMQYLRGVIYDRVHIYAFVVGGLLFYILLLRSSLIPRFIAIWGLVGILALMVSTVLGWFSISYALIDALVLLIITNEFFLAGWLWIKGLKKS